MNDNLLDLLACPACKAPLEYRAADRVLVCRAERLAYPIRDGIPVLLEDEATQLSSADVASTHRPGRG